MNPPIDVTQACAANDGERVRPEIIISAALHLMSAYSRDGGCRRLAHIILRHLELIAERDDVAPVMRQTCAQLIDEWERLLQRSDRPQPPTVPRSATPAGRLADVITLRRFFH